MLKMKEAVSQEKEKGDRGPPRGERKAKRMKRVQEWSGKKVQNGGQEVSGDVYLRTVL